MSPLVLFLSLAISAAGEPEAVAEPGPEPAQTPVEVSPEARGDSALPGSGWRQDLGLGLHSTTFWSNQGTQYTFHSLSLGYLNSWGRHGVFVHATGLLPLQGREDGHVYALHEYYGVRYGADLLTGYEWRWRAFENVEAETGGGFHFFFVNLKGLTGYRDFTASPFGLGGDGILRWRNRGRTLWGWPFTLGLYGSAALDLYDPVHGNDLRHGFTFRAGFLVGLDPGGNK